MIGKLHKFSYLILLLLIFLVFILIKLFSLSNEEKPSDYFPDSIMVKYFEGELENDEFIQIIDKVEDDKIQVKQINDNSKIVMVYDLTDTMIRLVYTYQGDEISDDYISNLEENRDDIIIKGPLKVGNSWDDNSGGVYEITEMDIIVRTPAGGFEALLVEYNNDQLNIKEYYAKEIGLIKIVINNSLNLIGVIPREVM